MTSHAQKCQQNNRDHGGRYATKNHDESDATIAAPDPRLAALTVPAADTFNSVAERLEFALSLIETRRTLREFARLTRQSHGAKKAHALEVEPSNGYDDDTIFFRALDANGNVVHNNSTYGHVNPHALADLRAEPGSHRALFAACEAIDVEADAQTVMDLLARTHLEQTAHEPEDMP